MRKKAMQFTLQDIPKYEAIQTMSERYPDADASAILSYLLMLRVSADVMDAASSRLHQYGISPGRFMVLHLLNQSSGESQNPSNLAERAGVTRATMTGLIDGLVQDGMATREVEPTNRRKARVSITSKGIDFLDSVMPGHTRFISRIMEPLSSGERLQFIELMQKIRNGFVDRNGDHAP